MSDTPENALKFAENSLIDNKSMFGLGGFGGYVIVGFDHWSSMWKVNTISKDWEMRTPTVANRNCDGLSGFE